MELDQAKALLIQAWGTLGTSWGINKTMAQIHVLLMISTKPLTTDDIMKELNISRGNANLNIRALLDWGIVYKKLIPGDRKEYFEAEKDMWLMTRTVAKERRKRELLPVQKILGDATLVDGENEEVKEFKRVTQDLLDLVDSANAVLINIEKLEENKFLRKLLSF